MTSPAMFLEAELDWLERFITARKDITGKISWTNLYEMVPSPALDGEGIEYKDFIVSNKLGYEERLLLILAMVPYLRPFLMNSLIRERNRLRLIKTSGNGLLPTAETFLQLVADNDLERRLRFGRIFETDHIFYRKSVLELGPADPFAPVYEGVISISKQFLDLFTLNRYVSPRFSQDFPAHRLETSLGWEDLVVNASTQKKLSEIRSFYEFEPVLKHKLGLGKHLKPGYRCLFYGPSGTGKTLAATLLGKYLDREVYRVDLSSVVSKYIGETAKNLNRLFNTAEDKDWILFFDEGDALFGKRTDTSENDAKASYYANQDIGFLLQRIENYNGLVIVASNLRKNMDDAFSRRFQNIILFDLPDEQNALRLWNENFPLACPPEQDIDFTRIIRQHPLPAASIINVITRVSLLALQQKKEKIGKTELEMCIRDEQYK